MTKQCINSLPPYYPVLVVDNGGDFDYPNKIVGDPSWSFARSCNEAASCVESDLLFLNNDTIARNDFIVPMMRLAVDEVGIVGAVLMYPDGRIQHVGSSYNGGNPNHPHKGETLKTYEPVTSTVEGVTFACAYITRACWEDLGGLDEDAYPFGYEDIDFCMRARVNGWSVMLSSESVLVHKEHVTQRKHLKSIRPRSDASLKNLRARWG
jgi:GT2 family glycosyltransferase